MAGGIKTIIHILEHAATSTIVVVIVVLTQIPEATLRELRLIRADRKPHLRDGHDKWVLRVGFQGSVDRIREMVPVDEGHGESAVRTPDGHTHRPVLRLEAGFQDPFEIGSHCHLLEIAIQWRPDEVPLTSGLVDELDEKLRLSLLPEVLPYLLI